MANVAHDQPQCISTTQFGRRCRRRPWAEWTLGRCWQHFQPRDLAPFEFGLYIELKQLALDRGDYVPWPYREAWFDARQRRHLRRGLYLVRGGAR